MKWGAIFLVLVLFTAGCVNQAEQKSFDETKKENGGVFLEGKNILMVIAPNNFRDEELMEPKEIFEDAGALVTIASKGTNSAKGMLGAIVTVDKDISEVKAEDYDAVVFVGGSGASVYFNNKTAQNLAIEAYESGKIVAAICIAPSTLANAGILEGKRATAFSSEKKNLENHGAVYTGKNVEADGNIITANGPDAAAEFGQAIAKSLKG